MGKDSKLSLAEWLSYVKGVFDTKQDACKGLLKLYEKQIGENKEIKLEVDKAVNEEKTADADVAADEKAAESVVVAEAATDTMAQEVPVVSVQPKESTTQPPATFGFFSCCAATTSA